MKTKLILLSLALIAFNSAHAADCTSSTGAVSRAQDITSEHYLGGSVIHSLQRGKAIALDQGDHYAVATTFNIQYKLGAFDTLLVLQMVSKEECSILSESYSIQNN